MMALGLSWAMMTAIKIRMQPMPSRKVRDSCRSKVPKTTAMTDSKDKINVAMVGFIPR